MTRIKLYGHPTSVYEYLKADLLKEARNAGIQIELEEIHEIQQFIDHGISSIPAVQINDNRPFELKANHINQFSKKARLALLNAENFGNMKQLIVPTDFSETANNALKYAAQLAPFFSSALQLVHFFHSSTASLEGQAYVNVEIEKIHRQRLAQLTSDFNTESPKANNSPLLHPRFEIGFPATGIPQIVEDINNGMIVIGSTGEGGNFKKIFGSVSMDVAKNSKVPVLVVPPEASFKSVKRIAYATSDMQLDATILGELIEVAEAFNAELFLLHIVQQGDPFSPYDALDMWDSTYDQSKISYFTLEEENIAEAINDFVEKEQVDWVAMATEDRGFFGELFHQSVTKKMARLCKKPLLVFHKEDQV